MQRLLTFVIGPAFLIVAFIAVLILLSFAVNEMRSGEPAVVHLKPGIQGGDREGDVTKSEKYVTVKSDAYGKETFTWDQILYITDKDPTVSRKFDRVVDLIDLLSKLGIAVTVIFFVIGLHQYGRSQKWEREKFLAAQVKEFIEWKPNRCAMHMIDSLALYKVGRVVELFPSEELKENRKTFVHNNEIYAALTSTPLNDVDESDVRAVAIRDCFDSFLSYMTTFSHYVQQDLISQDALQAQLGYWFELLGPEGSLDPGYKARVLGYATKYGLTGLEELVKIYNKPKLADRVLNFFIR